MRNIILAAATAAALLAGSTAVAAGAFYVSPQVGIGGMYTKKPTSSGDLQNYSLRGFAYRLDAGYLMPMNQNFELGAEVGYVGYVKNKYDGGSAATTMEYKGHYFDLLGVAKYNFNQNWNVFAKLGPAFVSQKTSGQYATTNSLNDDKSSVKAELAIGGAYQFNKNLGLNLNVYHVFGSSVEAPGTTGATKASLNKIASVSTLMLGLQYTFA